MAMERCQVCDGPVKDGRCKDCGMPYRNDEKLYHLNENRREHYEHASAKARTIMRENEIPLGDRGKTEGRKEQNAGKSVRGTARPSSGRVSAAAGGSRPLSGKKKVEYSAAAKKAYAQAKEKKGRHPLRRLALWLVALIFFFNVLPGLIYGLGDGIREIYWNITENEDTSVNDLEDENTAADDWVTEDAADVSAGVSYSLSEESGTVTAGEEIPEGTYWLSVDDGYASVEIAGEESRRKFSIRPGNDRQIELLDGDTVRVTFADEEGRIVNIQEQ